MVHGVNSTGLRRQTHFHFQNDFPQNGNDFPCNRTHFDVFIFILRNEPGLILRNSFWDPWSAGLISFSLRNEFHLVSFSFHLLISTFSFSFCKMNLDSFCQTHFGVPGRWNSFHFHCEMSLDSFWRFHFHFVKWIRNESLSFSFCGKSFSAMEMSWPPPPW